MGYYSQVTQTTDASTETRLAAAACGLAAGALLIWLLILAPRGLDFSDEGFYLTWLAQPESLQTSISQFGFVYHPVYRMLDGDIAALRRFNVLLTFGLAAWMFNTLLGDARGATRWTRAGVAMALACSSLAIFSLWLLTPNYNTLCLQSLLLAVIGAAMLEGKGWRSGSVLLGLGGALAFLAKPSSAAALSVPMLGVLAFLPPGRRTTILLLASGVAAGVLVVIATAIDGDPLRFVDELRAGNEGWQRLLGSNRKALFRWDPFTLTTGVKAFIAAGSGVALFAAAGLSAASRPARITGAIAVATAALISVGWLCASYSMQPRTQFVATVLCAPALAILPFAAITTDRRKLAQGLCIACLPAAFAFGTGNHYWIWGSMAGVFWIAGAAVAARGARISIWPPVAALSLLVSAMLLVQGAAAPYRQRVPIKDQLARISISERATLRIAEDSVPYVEALLDSPKLADWVPGTPAIDLTGQSPTALHLLRARALGYAWWMGGYAGSNDAARWMLARLPCEDLATAWLLYEPDGPLALDADLPQIWGLSIEHDYTVAAQYLTPPGAGGFAQPRTQFLLRPLKDAESAATICRASRAGTAQ